MIKWEGSTFNEKFINSGVGVEVGGSLMEMGRKKSENRSLHKKNA